METTRPPRGSPRLECKKGPPGRSCPLFGAFTASTCPCAPSCPGQDHTSGLLLLQLAHVLHRALVEAILLDDLPVVQHVELLCRVLPGEQQDGLRTAWVLSEEICHVVDIVAHNAPAILVRAVLSHLLRNDCPC